MLTSKEITRDDLDLYVRDFGSGMRFIKHPLVNELVMADFDDKIPEDFKRAILLQSLLSANTGNTLIIHFISKEIFMDC